jgi:hypothetical protein
LRANVERQRGWFALSPLAEQIVVHTGHSVEEADPSSCARRSSTSSKPPAGPASRPEDGSCSNDWTLDGRHPDLQREPGRHPGHPAVRGGSGAPRWSPDGTEIAIFCCDDGQSVHILDAETGEPRTLPQPDPGLEAFCGGPWSPDGQRLTCESFGTKDPGRNGIYSIPSLRVATCNGSRESRWGRPARRLLPRREAARVGAPSPARRPHSS